MSLQPKAKLGRYVIGELLGAGGMGSVYRAFDPSTKRHVAIKTIRPDRLTPGSRARFIRESQVVSRIEHPNVVRIYDVGTHEGNPFMVMQLLKGEPLESFLVREGALPLAEAVKVVLGICSGVAFCHEAGVTHRDLKPQNVFLAREGYRPYTKVFDFGLAKDLSSIPLTLQEHVLGTPGYLSPEEAARDQRRDIDSVVPAAPAAVAQASDQYSIGVILYRCLTGRLPIQGTGGMTALLEAIARGDFPPPRALRPEIPLALEDVVLRAMARSPFDRFQRVHDLGRALYDFASDKQRAEFEHFLHPPMPVPENVTRPHEMESTGGETPPTGASREGQGGLTPASGASTPPVSYGDSTAPRVLPIPREAIGSSASTRPHRPVSENETPPPPDPPLPEEAAGRPGRRRLLAAAGAVAAAVGLGALGWSFRPQLETGPHQAPRSAGPSAPLKSEAPVAPSSEPSVVSDEKPPTPSALIESPPPQPPPPAVQGVRRPPSVPARSKKRAIPTRTRGPKEVRSVEAAKPSPDWEKDVDGVPILR